MTSQYAMVEYSLDWISVFNVFPNYILKSHIKVFSIVYCLFTFRSSDVLHTWQRNYYTYRLKKQLAVHISRLIVDDYRYLYCIEGVRSVAYLIVFNKWCQILDNIGVIELLKRNTLNASVNTDHFTLNKISLKKSSSLWVCMWANQAGFCNMKLQYRTEVT